jgi:HJR/Mrr/RecB family endonuclease
VDIEDIVDAAITDKLIDFYSDLLTAEEILLRLTRALNRHRASAKRDMLRHVDPADLEDMLVSFPSQFEAVYTLREISKFLSRDQGRIFALRASGLTLAEISRELCIPHAKVRREIEDGRSALSSYLSPGKDSSRRLEAGVEEANRRIGEEKPIISPVASIVTLDLIDPALFKTLRVHPELLKSLDYRVFEKVLAEILTSLGYEVELQQGTKDGGVDIYAVKFCGVLGPHRYLLQAKRWVAAVGVEPVRELLFLHSHHKMTKSCLATTSRFTRGAWELAHDYRWQLELRDYERLQEWLNLASSGNETTRQVSKTGDAPDANRALHGRHR